MKKNNDFNEKMIEKTLTEMPVIKDKQSKEELFKQIQYKMQNSPIEHKKNNKRWLIPSMATVAAIIIFVLLIPSLFDSNEMEISMDESLPEAELMIVQEESVDSIENGEMRITIADQDHDMAIMKEEVDHFTAQESGYLGAANYVPEGKELVTIALPNGAAEYVVPITMAITKGGRTTLEQLEEIFQMISYDKWGLYSSPLSTFSFSEEDSGQTVIINAPSSNLESLSSSEVVLLVKSIQETFSALGYEHAEFSTDGSPGIVLGPYGEERTVPLMTMNRGYYLYESITGNQFLVPGRSVDAPLVNEHGEELSFEETIEQMQNGDAKKGYLASIPSHILLQSIEDEGSLATISFQAEIVEDTDETRAMIEAILFTAKDFGYSQVKFEGLGMSVIGDYWLAESIQVPLAINLVMIE